MRTSKNENKNTAPTVVPGGVAFLERLCAEASVPGLARIRLAPGYLFVPGLAPLWNELEASTADIELLIGNTADVLTDEQRVAAADIAAGVVAPEFDLAAAARAERDRVLTETATALRENLRHMTRTPDNDQLLLGLARAIGANRVRVRIYPEGRLHAKAALFEHTDGSAIALVGTSNLTLPAYGNPTELNVALTDPAAVEDVRTWLETLWKAGQDFTRAFFLEVSQATQSSAQITECHLA